MSQRQTTVGERNHFIDLKLAGQTLEEVAEETGWSFDCIRFWWRRYRDGGRKALDPPDERKQRGGPMSTFPKVIRFAFLRIKKEHPGWGADVARPRVAKRLDRPEEEMPSVSTIERHWAKFKDRLYRRHHKRHPPSKRSKGPKPKEPHERWQADFKVKVKVEGVGKVDVFNIRDDFSPVKIGSFVYASNEWDDRQIQEALRQAFTHWGLCDRFQTDRETRLVNTGAHPFPSRFTLWLAGLGITHEFAGSAQENGCAERFHRTWDGRVPEGQSFKSLDHLQQVSDEELDWMNRRLPSRGRACNGRSPLEAYPEAENARRPYSPEKELEIFSLKGVYRYLADQHWWRRVSQVGQISLGGHRHSVGTPYARQDVRVTFDADAAEFVVEDAQQVEIKRLKPKGLTVEQIVGHEPAPRQASPG
jgi:transposase-like protein